MGGSGWPLMLAFGTVALLPKLGSSSGPRWHSLHYFYTLMWDPGQEWPRFVAVGQLDGVVGGEYNSQTRRAVPRVPWLKRVERDDPHFFDWNSERGRNGERRLLQMESLWEQQQQNRSGGGAHTWQAMFGCERSEGGGETRGYYQYGFDGRDFLSFDKETVSWTAVDVRAQMTKRKWEAMGRTRKIKAYLESECLEWLQRFLDYGKEALSRKEPPVVRVSRAEGYDGLETLVCAVRGFLPKEIDAAWTKDGEVWEQETVRGGVVPNSDGTYSTSLRVEVDPKERARYRCRVDHDALAEPLDAAWEEPASILVGLIVGSAVAVSLVLSAFSVRWWVGRRGGTDYRPAAA